MNTKNSSWLNRNSLWLYFVLAYAISWSCMIPVALSAQGLVKWQVPYAFYYLASFGPMLSALLITGKTEGTAGIRRLLGRLLIWRVGSGYLAFTLLAPFALFVLAVILNRLVLGSWPDLSLLGRADYLPYLGPLGVFGVWLLTYGLGEEVGWRGFALPHLQRNRSAGNATLILAIVWACWHLPAIFFRDTYVDMGILAFPMLLISIIFAAAVFTWLYNSTGGSLLMVVLFHAIFNWLSVSEAGGQFSAILMSVPVILWSIFVMRRYGPENAAPIRRQMA